MKRHAALVPLSRQHHDGLALGVMIDRALGAGGAAPARLERLRLQALELWDLEFRGHFEVEERIVFPAARAAGETALVDALIAEHEALRQQFEALRQVPASDLGPSLRQLRTALAGHIRTEERVLFQSMQEAMGQPQLEDLGRAVDEGLPALCLSLGSAAA